MKCKLEMSGKVLDVQDEIFDSKVRDKNGVPTGQTKPMRRVEILVNLSKPFKGLVKVSRFSNPDNYQVPAIGSDFDFGAVTYKQDGTMCDVTMGDL